MVDVNNNSRHGRAKIRLSLTKLLTLVLCSIIVVFIGFTLITYSRLAEFRSILANVENELVPTVISSGQAYNQIAMLIYLTESLSKASNETERIGSYMHLKERLESLQKNLNLNSKEPYLVTQLSILDIELEELNQLTKQKLNIETIYKKKMLQLVHLYRNVLDFNPGKLTENEWVSKFIKITTNIALINNMKSIGDIRQVIKKIDSDLLELKAHKENSVTELQNHYTDELVGLLTGKEGILSLRSELVLTRGRTLGRGNFVRNLLLDYASGADFQSYKTNEAVTEQVANSLELVNQNISKVVLIASAFIAFLLIVIIIVHIKLTLKLKNLYRHVKDSLIGNKYDFSYGKDEISDIYHIFDLFVHDVESQRQMLREISLTDSLTNIPNRRAFDEKLCEYLNLAKREEWPISILMIDVDYFKAYNDNYGHLEGDECLVEVATILKKLMKRNGDFIARYGGEEFACILLNTKVKGAEKVAQNIIDAMAGNKIQHGFSDVMNYVTVSIGGATCFGNKGEFISSEDLLSKADSALYKAKENGRNRFEMDICQL